MPSACELKLDEVARETLIQMRDHHPLPYLRERAAALLKLAEGQSVNAVAQGGLLRRRQWGTVRAWLRRYQQGGLGGLYVRAGRGRKPAFPPTAAGAGA